MKHEHSYEKAKKAINARNMLIVLVGTMALANVLLAAKVYRKDTTTILTPSEITQTLVFHGERPDKTYVRLMLVDIMTLLCDINPNTAQSAEDMILRIVHPASYGAVKLQLDHMMAEYRLRGMSTVFYPGLIEVADGGRSAKVHGVFDTYIGKERVSSKNVTFAVGLDFSSGRLLLTKFHQM